MTGQAIHFGAGKIGRGFLGQLYAESGYRITFVDVDAGVVSALNARGGYPIRIVGEAERVFEVRGVRAIDGRDLEAVAAAVAAADLASTAVGGAVLPRIAGAYAAGLAKRFAGGDGPPLDCIVCENLLDASGVLRSAVRAALPAELGAVFDARAGFVNASIGRMAPDAAAGAGDPLEVRVEAYCELPVDREGFRGPLPALRHLAPAERFAGYVARKLFMHNMSHAAAAYLGHLRGLRHIWEAIRDERVRPAVESALGEAGAALHRVHGLDAGDLEAHAADLLRRYDNPALGDQVARVAADPARKLGREDRLIGAGLLCESAGVAPDAIAFAAAAAIRYDPGVGASSRVPSSPLPAQVLSREGLSSVLRRFCGLEAEAPLARRIAAAAARLESEGWLGQDTSCTR